MPAERLEGWKEIAEYLNRAPRTVQGWERDFGLPIRRLQGRTYAEVAELDRWVAEHEAVTGKAGRVELEVVAAPPPAKRLWWWWAVGLAVTVGVGVYFWLRPGGGVDYLVRGSMLAVLDRDGKTVWEFALPTTPPKEERGFGVPDRGMFADVDGDGRVEFLYRYWPTDLGKDNSVLYCFGRDGAVRWAYRPGGPVRTTKGTEVKGPYQATMVGVLKKPRADGGRIVLASNHAWDWPQQVVILTGDGKPVEEYWHPGWFFSMEIGDLDGDGEEEILLGGVNNAYGAKDDRGATLVVLDSRDISGQGSVPEGYGLQVAGVKAGRERRVLLFPEFAPNENPNHYVHVGSVRLGEGGTVTLVLTQGFGKEIYGHPYAHVDLNRELAVTRVLPGARLAALLDRTLPETERTPDGRGRWYRQAVGAAVRLR